MTALKARRNRTSDVMEPLFTRLSPEAKQMLKNAAQASGTSISLYLETLVRYEALNTGSLPVWGSPAGHGEVASRAA